MTFRTGVPHPLRGRTVPTRWLYGTDPVLHAQHHAFLRARAQAVYRGQPWLITLEQYSATWGDQWRLHGRSGPARLNFSRRDHSGPWSMENVHIAPRSCHTQRARASSQDRVIDGVIDRAFPHTEYRRDGSWHAIICSADTLQDWSVSHTHCSCVRFNVDRPAYADFF